MTMTHVIDAILPIGKPGSALASEDSSSGIRLPGFTSRLGLGALQRIA